MQTKAVRIKLAWVSFGLIPVLFLLLYYPVFYANYSYLDEIHQLWHNNDRTNLTMFVTQGRWLAGLLFQKTFSAIHTIAQLKLVRLFSLIGWVVTTLVWAVVLKNWVRRLQLPESLCWLGVLYVACCIPVVVYIGWASCMEIFLAVLAALVSAHLAFTAWYQSGWSRAAQLTALLLAAVCALVALSIYQSAFGIFLIPFLLLYIQEGRTKPNRMVLYGVAFFLAMHLLYYPLFQFSLGWFQMQASTRTALHPEFLNKLSFFFSGPLPQGFSLNVLFSARSLLSQAFYIAVILIWLIALFRRNKSKPVLHTLLFIIGLLLLLALIYLPGMIASENFASYRTLFAFNLAVFLMVLHTSLYGFSLLKKEKVIRIAGSIFLLLTGLYAYRFQFVAPLVQEYEVLKKFMTAHYHPGITRVQFIRADKFLFQPQFHTQVYRDELGAPSTYRNWVPEPIVKQLVLEQTGSRATADAVQVKQYETEAAFAAAPADSTALVINMNRLFQQP